MGKKSLEALEQCIDAGLFIEPLRRMGPGQVVLLMTERNASIREALANLTSDDLSNLRYDYVRKFLHG